MTFSLALQEQYRAEYWQKQDKKLHGTVFSNKYHPLLIFCPIANCCCWWPTAR